MEEIDALRSLLRVFHKKFPQIVFCVLVIDLGEEVSISEYGFWLINRARFGGAGIIGAKNFDLFFVIDPKGRAAGLIAGYGLEAYLSEQDLQDALAVANSGFDAGDLICGMRECIEFLTIRVREIVLRIEESRALENRAAILTANSDAS